MTHYMPEICKEFGFPPELATVEDILDCAKDLLHSYQLTNRRRRVNLEAIFAICDVQKMLAIADGEQYSSERGNDGR